MTNEELKAAIRDFNNAYNYEEDNEEHIKLFDGRYPDIFEYWRELDIITQAARELLQLKDGMHPDMVMVPGWKPIETAPMCEDIDVWTQYGRYVRCQHDDYGHWYIWSDEFNQYVTLAPSTKPTHWMPLPVAPKGETK